MYKNDNSATGSYLPERFNHTNTTGIVQLSPPEGTTNELSWSLSSACTPSLFAGLTWGGGLVLRNNKQPRMLVFNVK